ncbi:MAG TPA: PepSY domain-containing protein [Rubellimicrobium sp.]|jgi:hypothetical protein|nr:PepSY domain-containing protein [Rubellimicrobium sp.]
MTPRTLIATLAFALALGGTAARAEDDEAALDPAKDAEIRALLVEQGYEVRSVGMEDGRIEVYAVKDGQPVEVYLNADLTIAEVKEED